jgi:hypothetical protein
VLIAAAVIMALFAACSDDKGTTTEPVQTDYEKLYVELFGQTGAGETEVVIADSTRLALDLATGLADSASFTKGGYQNYIEVPDSAALGSVQLAVDYLDVRFVQGNDSSRSAMVFVCEPEGTVFENSLVFDFQPGQFNNHPTSNVVKLYIYDESEGRWRLEQTHQKTDPRVRFEIDHFSRYGISD